MIQRGCCHLAGGQAATHEAGSAGLRDDGPEALVISITGVLRLPIAKPHRAQGDPSRHPGHDGAGRRRLCATGPCHIGAGTVPDDRRDRDARSGGGHGGVHRRIGLPLISAWTRGPLVPPAATPRMRGRSMKARAQRPRTSSIQSKMRCSVSLRASGWQCPLAPSPAVKGESTFSPGSILASCFA